MNPISNRKLLVVATTGLVCLLLWLFSLSVLDDFRFTDNAITTSELLWWEALIMIPSLLLVLLVWICAFFHALSVRKGKWGIFIFFIWPLSFIYAWFFAHTSKITSLNTD